MTVQATPSALNRVQELVGGEGLLDERDLLRQVAAIAGKYFVVARHHDDL